MVEEDIVATWPHLRPESRELMGFSYRERLAYLNRNLWINYLGAQQILDRLEELINLPQMHRMPNMLIIGPSNNGKTMIKEKFCKTYNDTAIYRDIGEGHGVGLFEKSVISIQMPAMPTFRMLLLSICEAVERAKYLKYMIVSLLNLEVYRILKELKVKMLIIDELHNMLASSAQQRLVFLNFIRHLGNELQIPLVCLGTKDAYLAIKTDPQLENRLEPFTLPLWEEGLEFNNLLESFTATLPLEYYSDLTDPKIVDWLLGQTGGILGEIAAILKLAAKRAIMLGKEQIDLKLLKELNYRSPKDRSKSITTMLSK